MEISNRLKEVGKFIKTPTFLDIGCDHALMSIYLLKHDKSFTRVINSDNKEGPLNSAKENIKKYNLSKKIELKLGDGLDTYEKGIETVSISGMGGRTIIGIIKNHMEYLNDIEYFVLSPNNYQEDVKRFLTHNGYLIDDEALARDGKFIYEIIRFKKGKKKYTNREYFFGPILLTKKNRDFNDYYNRRLMQNNIILKLLPKNHYLFRKMKLKKENKMIADEIKKDG